MRRAVTVLVLASALAPSLASAEAPSLEALFTYDAAAPLRLQELGVERRGEVSVRDVTFVGHPKNEPVRAYVVTPPGKGPFAGVLFVHWLGSPETTHRTEFVQEAVGMAGRGAVSVLVDAMWSKPQWFKTRTCETDFEASVRQVVDLRRALDVLLAQPGVDPARVGFVGHDFGAMYGALMGAVDHRPKTFVLMAFTPSFPDWYLLGKPPSPPLTRERYLEQMSALDLVQHIGKLSPASVFLQFAANDRFVPADKAEALTRAANHPKLSKTYDVGHSLETKVGTGDRFLWLAKELKLQK